MVRLVKLPEVRARIHDQTLMPVGDNTESFARTLKQRHGAVAAECHRRGPQAAVTAG